MDGNFEVVVIRGKGDVKVLKDGLTEKEAHKVKDDWTKVVFNSEVYFEPAPKLKVRRMNTSNED